MAPSATQNDVARMAGVSQATVSLVLSGAAGKSIPAETVARVTEVARKLGYAPNRFAQALRTNRTMTIVCIVPDITNPFYPSLVRGVQSVAEKADYDVIMVNSDGQKEREQHFVNMALQGRVDGVIGIFFHLTAAELKPVTEAGVPIVRLEARSKKGGELPIDDVYVDNFAAAQDITRFLLEKGHRHIVMIAGRGGPQYVRVQGYEATLKATGLRSRVTLDDEFTEDGGQRAAAKALQADGAPTALIAANDLMAIGAMSALRTAGKSIPADVAVTGFDNIPASRLVSPALTTVSQFQDAMGAEAARRLLARLNGDVTGPGGSHPHPFEIIERGST